MLHIVATHRILFWDLGSNNNSYQKIRCAVVELHAEKKSSHLDRAEQKRADMFHHFYKTDFGKTRP